MPEGEEVAHDRMVNMAAGWHRVGLERPHFVATGTVAVAPAQQMEAGEEGKKLLIALCVLPLFFPSDAGNCHADGVTVF